MTRGLEHSRHPSSTQVTNDGGGAFERVHGRNGTLFTDEAPDLPVWAVTPRPIRKTAAHMDLVIFLPLIIIMGLFMFFASRRQKKAMQATIDLHESLQIGDRIHTTSGMEATITGIGDDTVELEIAPGVITTWMKLAVRDKIGPDTEDDDDFDGFDDEESTSTEITESPNTKD
jgi:preprotein translocase subunit YajC